MENNIPKEDKIIGTIHCTECLMEIEVVQDRNCPDIPEELWNEFIEKLPKVCGACAKGTTPSSGLMVIDLKTKEVIVEKD